MNPSRAALAVLVPVLAASGAAVHYAVRAALPVAATDAGEVWSTLSTLLTLATLAAYAVAALLGALTGGGALATIGLVAVALGSGLLGGEMLYAGGIVEGMGRALLTVGLGAVVARLFGPRQESGRLSLFAFVYAGMNAGSLVAPKLAAILATTLGASAVFFGAAGLAAGLAVLAIAASAAEFFTPRDAAEDVRVAVAPPVLATAALVLIGGSLGWAAFSVGGDLLWTNLPEDLTAASLVLSVNPLVVTAVGGLAGVGFAAAGFAGVEVPALAVAGVGLLLVGGGLAVGAVSGAAGFAVAQAIVGAGEAFTFAGILAAATTGTHWRLGAFVVATLSASGLAASWIVGKLPELPPAVGIGVAAVLCAGVGIGMAGAALPVRAWLASVWAAESEAEPAS